MKYKFKHGSFDRTKEYLVIWFGPMGTGTYFRSKNENLITAVETCAKCVADDWASMYNIEGQKITLVAFDVSALDECQWDAGNVWTLDEDEKRVDLLENGYLIEHFQFYMPKKRLHQKRYFTDRCKKELLNSITEAVIKRSQMEKAHYYQFLERTDKTVNRFSEYLKKQ